MWNWYAWPHLVSPITAAYNIVNRHMKIMQSYVISPELHQEANQIPAMIGGPFIDLEGDRTNDIAELASETKQNCAPLLSLFHAINTFNKKLMDFEKGYSLESLYRDLPEELKGLCELVYDHTHHPTIRFIEPLIYQEYYRDMHQAIAFFETNSDKRPFVLSTPRIKNNIDSSLSIPFADQRLDRLFAMRYRPDSLEEVISELGIVPNEKFYSLFTEQSPILKNDRHYHSNDIRIRYFGHACVLVQSAGKSILIDPLISYDYRSPIERFSLSSLPDVIDYVLITHNHQDHCSLETLLQIRHKIKNIIVPNNQTGNPLDPSLKLILKQIGFKKIIVLEEFDSIQIAHMKITGLPFLGEHACLNIQTKLAYLIEVNSHRVLFVADSNNLDNCLYKRIYEIVGKIDTLFIGMECEGAPLSWLYGPLITQEITKAQDMSRRLSGSDSSKAWKIAQQLKCNQIYIYAMGQEPWLSHIMALNDQNSSKPLSESEEFIARCLENGIYAERLLHKKEFFL